MAFFFKFIIKIFYTIIILSFLSTSNFISFIILIANKIKRCNKIGDNGASILGLGLFNKYNLTKLTLDLT